MSEGEPNFKHLPPGVVRLTELRAELAEAKTQTTGYENNLKIQVLTRQIEDLMDSPAIRPTLVKG